MIREHQNNDENLVINYNPIAIVFYSHKKKKYNCKNKLFKSLVET